MAKIISNSEVAFDRADKELSDLGALHAAGQVSRIDFIARAAELYVAKELRHEAPKGKGKVTHTHFAEHAVKMWNAKQAAKLGKGDVAAAVGSRVSEVGAILRATAACPDIVPLARSVDAALRAANTEDYKTKTYEAIVTVARAQAKNMDARITEDEARAALMPTAAEPDEAKDVAATVKKLEKMAKDFPMNAAVYAAAIAALAPVANILTGDRAKFIAKAVKNGFSATDAAAFYDSKAVQKAA